MNKEYVDGTYIKKDTNETVLFKCLVNPSLSDKQHIVNQTVNSIVDENFYHMFLKDIISDLYIVSNLTNVDLSQIANADYSADAVEDFINNTTVISSIIDLVGNETIREIKSAIDYGIEYKTGIHENNIGRHLDSLIHVVNDLFSSIDPEEISSFIQRVNSMDGDITADKVLEAYASSDAVKRLYEETDKRRQEQNKRIVDILEDIRKEKK